MNGRRLRTGPGAVTAALVLAAGFAASPARAVSDATVDRYVRLSDAFHAQLSRSPIAGLSADARRARAVCILSRFEQGFGAEGVAALMELMDVLSQGAEFDDPTIIAFNDRFGASYDRTETECTGQARGS